MEVQLLRLKYTGRPVYLTFTPLCKVHRKGSRFEAFTKENVRCTNVYRERLSEVNKKEDVAFMCAPNGLG